MELRTLLFSIAAVLLAGVTADPDDPPAQLAGYASLRDARSAAQALAGWSASQRRSWWHHTYSSRYDERRYFAQWEGNLNRTIAWNKKSGITYWQGLAVDDFSVLTWSQLSGTYLMRGINPGAVEGSASAQALSSASPTTGRCKAGAVIPADWDWRSSGIGNRVPMIRPSQGKCGSCWAQAATAALESRAMIDGVNVGPNLSEQQLLDCVNAGNGYRSQGCQGGLAEEALDYASRFFEADEGSYARARGRGCKTQAAGVGGGVSLVSRPGWRRVASSAGQIKRAVYCEGPVLAYVQIDRNFAYYQGGIYPASACRAQTSKSTFNHAVVIVGYSSGIKPYWIIRNSWGSTWGQGGTADLGGYALMELTFDAVGPCGAYRYPLVPLATRKARPPVAPPPRPPPPPPGPEWVCTCSNEDVVIKQLASWDGQYTFGLQGNRNIVLSRKLATQTVVLWQSNTGVARPQAPLTLVLQQDGNLVGYEGPPGSRTPFWRSGTAGLGAGPYRLALQINQNAVLYDGNGRALWSTASGEPSSPFYKRNWVAVASSSTGNQLSAVVGFGAWWHSADSGRTWTSDGSQRDWADVAMSGDGSVQFAAVRGGSVYFTADSFASVFGAGDDLGKRQWSSIACSNDGTQFVVADKGGSLWTATVFLSNPALPGITPVEHTAAGSRKWVSVAMSADGQSILAAADGPGPLWASSDGGSTWREVTCPGNRAWTGVAIAGGFQVAVERGGLVWSNTAPGNGWSECGTWGDLGKRNWASVAAAPSGNDIVLAAAAAGGGIWTARIVVDSSAHDYRIDPDSISEGAARTEGAQPWSSVALASDSGAITAVAPFSFWGIFRSEDSSSQIWAPPMRGIRRFVFSNVTTSTFPQPRLPLEKNEVVPGFAPVVGKFMAQVFNGSLIVPVTGSYQIFLGSVDGSRLYLNGQLVLDNSGLHPMTFVDNNFTLGAGWYKLRLETIQWKDPGAVALEWQGVGTDGRRQAISADYLSPSQI